MVSKGMKEMHDAAPNTIAQDEASVWLFGMPNEAYKSRRGRYGASAQRHRAGSVEAGPLKTQRLPYRLLLNSIIAHT
jgi:hypothetical protein